MSTSEIMSVSRITLLVGLLVAAPAIADSPGLGAKITEADVGAWAITVLPDGTNLPAGSGTAAQGAKTYAEKCVACHGEGGKGGPYATLVSDVPLQGRGIEAPKTIKNFWANATTVYDYIRRAMPWPNPRTLSDEEVYGLVAYILSENKIIEKDAVMDAKSLPQVKMPNRDNFIVKFPDKI
jgi:mono/diheme cytochrome c family protein